MTLVFELDYDHPESADEVVALVGGKAAHLGVMARDLGLPVPPGFVVSTQACRDYLEHGWPEGLTDEITTHMRGIERIVGRGFADPRNPLLVSVRSGAAVSMPGMMDTILNLGLNEQTVAGLAEQSRDTAFAAACRDRLTAMFRETVGVEQVPDDPWLQLRQAIEAVFRSWNSDRARAYRRVERIPDDLGTAVTVQAMVFGNLGVDSGTGVLFTRNPATGERTFFGDVLFDAQGEDVVAGTHRTDPVATLRDRMPRVGEQLWTYAEMLERHFADMCDIEFTIEQGRLWLLQVRVGKRSPQAALRLAVDMATDPQFPLTKADAVNRVANQLATPPTTFARDPDDRPPIAHGLPASPGLASGEIQTSPAEAIRLAETGSAVILVRAETSPEDVPAMARSKGVLTCRGGIASHAAVVARGWGIPAVVGVSGLQLSPSGVTVNGRAYAVGDVITIDGSTGDVYPGAVHGKEVVSPDAETLLGWARELGIAIGAPSSSPTPDRADTADAEAADPDEVLTTLSIRTISTVDALASAALVSPQALRITLDRLDAEGLISLTSGFVQLTEGGAARADGRRERERGAWGPAAAVEALNRFARLDKEMKDTVTSWQMRTGDGEQRINDHADSNYDAAVLARLATLHADTDRWLGSLTGAPDRMARYRRRLDRAMDAVRGGDVTFVASPQVDSFHTIWFDLHEDLIRLAGRTREDEAAAGRA